MVTPPLDTTALSKSVGAGAETVFGAGLAAVDLACMVLDADVSAVYLFGDYVLTVEVTVSAIVESVAILLGDVLRMLSTGPVGVFPMSVVHSAEGCLSCDYSVVCVTTYVDLVLRECSTVRRVETLGVPSVA